MKQAKWIISSVIIVGVIVGLVFAFSNDSPKANEKKMATEVVVSDDVPLVEDSETAPAEAVEGNYIEYSEGLLTDSTIGTKVLFFHAPWCPQCRELEASIKAGEIPSDVTIIKVDYDSNQSLRSRYGVTIQTSLVRISADGDLVKKYVAYDEPSLKSLIENVL